MKVHEVNKADFEHALRVQRETGIKYQKKWISASIYNNRKRSNCHLAREIIGFIDLNYEYAEGILYPSVEGCEFGEKCSCRIIFRLI